MELIPAWFGAASGVMMSDVWRARGKNQRDPSRNVRGKTWSRRIEAAQTRWHLFRACLWYFWSHTWNELTAWSHRWHQFSSEHGFVVTQAAWVQSMFVVTLWRIKLVDNRTNRADSIEATNWANMLDFTCNLNLTITLILPRRRFLSRLSLHPCTTVRKLGVTERGDTT